MIFSMSIWFGLIFAICGLALAVLLGIILYRETGAGERAIEKSLGAQKAAERI